MVPSIAVSVRTTRVLWMSLVISTLLYLALLAKLHPAPQAVPAVEILVIAIAAATTGALSLFLPSRQLIAALRRLELRVVDQIGEPVGSFRESAPVRRVVADAEAAVRAAMPAYQTSLILGMALAEAVALFGFALGFLGQPAQVVAPFFVVCWALMATKFPRLVRITRAIETSTRAECRLGS